MFCFYHVHISELSSIKSLFFHLFESHKSEKSNILSLYDKCSVKKQTYSTTEQCLNCVAGATGVLRKVHVSVELEALREEYPRLL